MDALHYYLKRHDCYVFRQLLVGFLSWLMLFRLATNLSLPLHFPGELLTLYRNSPPFLILIDVVHSTFEAAQLKILYRIEYIGRF